MNHQMQAETPGKLEAYFSQKIKEIDQALDVLLPKGTEQPGKLHEAMRYSVFAGGKRIRPILCLAVAEGLGKNDPAILKAACALEILHTYSLIHDDLPAMDNDDFRRGKPTNHKVFGEAMAILAGDALLTLSFAWINHLSDDGITLDATHQALSVFAKAVGHAGMVGGQSLDMEAEGRSISYEQLRHIHAWKTGALLSASVELGAILGGAPSAEIALFREFGNHLGLLFQVVDDILDEEGDSANLGKTVGKDKQQGKATYPSILGMPKAKSLAEEMKTKSLETLRQLSKPIPLLNAITEFIYQRRH